MQWLDAFLRGALQVPTTLRHWPRLSVGVKRESNGIKRGPSGRSDSDRQSIFEVGNQLDRSLAIALLEAEAVNCVKGLFWRTAALHSFACGGR